ncbi:MAG: DUF6282 family protein [Synergistaceae bacterium]|nr:DUF6282 family protein [Synergistaceae bacterium]
MPKISVKGACDLHIHSSPDLGERVGDDVDVALACRDAGMRAIGIKCHLDTTMGRAYHTEKTVEGIKVYGGITLNMQTGGINPAAVDAALQFGAKLVWMPTFHSAYQVMLDGKPGLFNPANGYDFKPVTILDESGKVKSEVPVICKLVLQYDAILSTGHLSPDESLELIKVAKDVGLKKIVVTHPFFTPPAFTMEQLKEAVENGAFVEFSTNALNPLPKPIDIHLYSEAVSRFGSERFIIGSDCGHPRKSMPHEAIRAFAYTLNMLGVSLKDLEAMMSGNYDKLLPLA